VFVRDNKKPFHVPNAPAPAQMMNMMMPVQFQVNLPDVPVRGFDDEDEDEEEEDEEEEEMNKYTSIKTTDNTRYIAVATLNSGDTRSTIW